MSFQVVSQTKLDTVVSVVVRIEGFNDALGNAIAEAAAYINGRYPRRDFQMVVTKHNSRFGQAEEVCFLSFKEHSNSNDTERFREFRDSRAFKGG